MLTTTIEEKSNKVMEVLLSAISPMQLMTGKILGQAGVAAIMLFMYGGLGIAALVAFSLGDLLPFSLVVYTLLFFVAAFFMIATIMAIKPRNPTRANPSRIRVPTLKFRNAEDGFMSLT